MRLADQMHASVADVTTDLNALAADARRYGVRQRRRREAFGTFCAAAAVAAIVGGALAMQPGAEAPPRQPDPPSVATGPGLRGETAEATGAGTAAALQAAVEEVADGDFTAFRGQDPRDDPPTDPHEHWTYATFKFTPTDGGVGEVGLNLQPLAILHGEPQTCTEWMLDCTVTDLSAGDTLRTYREAPNSDAGNDVRLVAEVLSPRRDLRIVAAATNGIEHAANRWDINGPDAVLSTAQLTEIVTQPWWGFELPKEYVDAGEDLDYEDIDSFMARG